MKFKDWFNAQDKTGMQLAKEMGTTSGTISNLLTGKNQGWISRKLAEKIVRITGGKVTPDDFFFNSGE